MTSSKRAATFVWAAGLLLLVAAFLSVYYPTLRKLSDYWASSETYSYGFLVPAISGYLVWLRWDRLRSIPRSPSLGAGGVVLAAGLLMMIAGRESNTNLIEELSLPLSVCGVVLLVFGRRVTQSLTFPLLYLLTMIPFWEFLTGRLHLPFQLYSAAMGVGALRIFGIPVFHEGVLIELPNITLEVAELCSGVNNLVAVLCIGVPLTHFYIKGWLKRGFILSSAVLIALLSNGVRVAIVCFFAYYGIRGANGDVHGPFALLRTLAISGVGFVVLFWLISRFADRPDAVAESTSAAVAAGRPTHWAMHSAAWALAVGLLVGAVRYERVHALTPVPLNVHLIGFPNEIAEWRFARLGSLLPSLVGDANFDQSTSRVYATPEGAELELLLGYFERQEQGKELVGFGLSRVIPARATGVTSQLNDAQVKDGLLQVKGKTYHVTYWYLVGGRVATEGYEAKLWTTLNSITTGRNNGGIIVVSRALDASESIEASRSKVRRFLEELMHASTAYFPQG